MAVEDWTGTDWAAIMTAGAVVMGAIGGGIGALLTRADKNKLSAMERESIARAGELKRQEELRDDLEAEVERRFAMQTEQMETLRKTLVDQATTLRRYEGLLDDYGMHVNKLEEMMRVAGLAVPRFEPRERRTHQV